MLGLFCSSSFSLAEMLSIKTDNVNIRSGPGRNNDIIWEFGKGFPLKVIDAKGDWIKIEDFEGDRGWVHKTLTSKSAYLVVRANKGSNNTINVRKHPSTDAEIIANAKYGVVFKTIEQKDGWAKVRHEEENVEGWINRSLLWGF